eukprot:CAMPEP_0175768284 /NCGR_PEP_ID=MMETSP0097-20121207/70351_1 /TAXON_ID=311494 /ORGANISM="Alexandrium monilatum, Strain CCMP3105" /LENGTH=91 /DNA_ID=CAMNT_0017078395 /DNA_START=205 /DNA_END=478 /DNA_ORIENTATION=+
MSPAPDDVWGIASRVVEHQQAGVAHSPRHCPLFLGSPQRPLQVALALQDHVHGEVRVPEDVHVWPQAPDLLLERQGAGDLVKGRVQQEPFL